MTHLKVDIMGKKDKTKVVISRKSNISHEQYIVHTFQRFCAYESGIKQSCENFQPCHSPLLPQRMTSV